MLSKLTSNDFNPFEPYHKILIEIYNNNLKAIENVLEKGIDKDNLNLFVWIDLVTTLMTTVEKYKKLNGNLKQRIVLDICLLSIDKAPKLSKNLKFKLKLVIKSSLPHLINILVSLSTKINTKSKFGKCLSKSFTCLCLSTTLPEPESDIILTSIEESKEDEEEKSN